MSDPVVADLLSGDRRRVLDAVWTVMATRDPQVLAPVVPELAAIRQATSDLDLGGALVTGSANLACALARVELFAAGACLCAAYPDHLGYDPAREEARGHVRVVGEVANERQWEPDRVCECTGCGRRWQVEHGESHYAWWQWRPLTPRARVP